MSPFRTGGSRAPVPNQVEDKSSEVPAPEVVSIFLIFPHMRLLSVKPPLCLPRHLAIDENCKKKLFNIYLSVDVMPLGDDHNK